MGCINRHRGVPKGSERVHQYTSPGAAPRGAGGISKLAHGANHGVGGWCNSTSVTHRSQTSSKRHIVQGTHRPRDTSSKRHIVQETHSPRDTSSKRHIVRKDTSPKRHIVQEKHRPRDTLSKGTFGDGDTSVGDTSSRQRFIDRKNLPLRFFHLPVFILNYTRDKKSCNYQCTTVDHHLFWLHLVCE
jgi:hypothetical protein